MLAKLISRVAAAGSTAVAAVPPPTAAANPLDLMRLVMRYNLHPQADLHSSWLPAAWPAPYRRMARFGPAGHEVLAALLAGEGATEPDYRFDSRLKRLALFDAGSLRRLAMMVSLGVHLPLLRQRSPAGTQLRRQARRYDPGLLPFAFDRMPPLPGLRMDAKPLEQRPLAAGRLLVGRGYRLLLAALAPEGDEIVRRVRRKFPRRLAALSVPRLEPRQSLQLSELMLLCIVPERLPQWDWLF